MAWGWIVQPEVSFSHYGDRGRVDLLAWDPRTRLVLVIEVKSAIGDLQEMLGRLDVKARLANGVPRTVGWTDVAGVIPAFVIRDGPAARRVVRSHAALFARFDRRGRSALRWIRRPSSSVPHGALRFVRTASDSRAATTIWVRLPREAADARTP